METTDSPEVKAQRGGMRVARMGDRVLAAILDTIALLAVYTLAAYCIGVWYDSYQNGNVNLSGGPALLFILVIAVIWIAYYVVGEAVFRGTIGKHVAAIEVGSPDSLSIKFSQALVRNLLRPIDAIGFYLLGCLVALSSKQNQTIGDRAAGTIVYEKDGAKRGSAVALWVAIFIGGWILAVVFRHYAVPINH